MAGAARSSVPTQAVVLGTLTGVAWAGPRGSLHPMGKWGEAASSAKGESAQPPPDKRLLRQSSFFILWSGKLSGANGCSGGVECVGPSLFPGSFVKRGNAPGLLLSQFMSRGLEELTSGTYQSRRSLYSDDYDNACCLLGARLPAECFTWTNTAKPHHHVLK